MSLSPTQRTFTVPGVPGAKGRPRFARAGKGVRTFTPKKTARYEERIRLAAINEGIVPTSGPVSMQITAVWPSRKPDRKKNPRKAEWRPSRPDIDNVVKVCLDALNGVAFDDDAQVVEVIAAKRRAAQGDPAHLCVTIRNLTP